MRTCVLLLLSIALLAAPAAMSAQAPSMPPATESKPAAAPTADELVRRIERFPATKGTKGESERLAELFDLYWQLALAEFPELATYTGVPAGQDRWTDQSLERIAVREAWWPKAMAAIESVDRGRLTPAEQLNHDLFRRNVRLGAESTRFPGEYLALNQMNGVQHDPPQMIALMPARSVADYENIVGRLRNLPALVDQTIALLCAGARARGHAAAHHAARRAAAGREPDRRRLGEEPAARRLPELPGGGPRGGARAPAPRGDAGLCRAGGARLPAPARVPGDDLPPEDARDDRPLGAARRRGLVRVQRPAVDDHGPDAAADPRDRPGRGEAHPRRDGRGDRADRLQGRRSRSS